MKLSSARYIQDGNNVKVMYAQMLIRALSLRFGQFRMDANMSNTVFYKIIVIFIVGLLSSSAMAWNHGVSLGYGGGSDINHPDNTNSGEFLSAEFMPIKQKDWVNVTFNGSLGNFYSTAPVNKDLFTTALSLAFRFYKFSTPKIHPFFLASAGPSYMSNRHFGYNNQASNFAFQSVVGAGLEFGKLKRVDLNVRLVHYSNAYLMIPNEGFNIFYIVSLGYLF